jgi:hypothetical protein
MKVYDANQYEGTPGNWTGNIIATTFAILSDQSAALLNGEFPQTGIQYVPSAAAPPNYGVITRAATQEDLDAFPQLVSAGVKVGDLITVSSLFL